MTGSARQALERARVWATEHERVAAAFVHGSLAHGDDNDLSDLDLIVVARDGGRDALWSEREQIAMQVLGGPIAWSWELPWQRPYRYQAWLDDLSMLDLTLDEGKVLVWHGLLDGVTPLVDRGALEVQFRADVAELVPEAYDAEATDASTWTFLNWLVGRLVHGQYWFVRANLHEPLAGRILPLLGTTAYAAERDLSSADLAAVTSAAPRSSEAEELLRALKATVALYDLGLDRWAERTGKARPRHPLASAVCARIDTLVL